jgi:ribose transport system permease protein
MEPRIQYAKTADGVNIAFWKSIVYMLCGLFAGLGGVLMAARLNSAQPALGAGYELDAIAAVVIGGTSLSGGEGSILGTIIGAFIMSVLINGLRINSVPQEIQLVITGDRSPGVSGHPAPSKINNQSGPITEEVVEQA